ncbi:Isochorismatase hydrolase [Mytilinidion resinicola]|uniref:Isochorismatase hydrolase n=1 Tax=Mytilinidion resinicola TaxID=574789 RepID=A0A6A6Y6Z8_9PEZI|nr:Isochorismatase hydrolase [Mytilinidion resinicola]KAF2804596.1 Isochorismatase hydrolase [Mytilinidion resinicola]
MSPTTPTALLIIDMQTVFLPMTRTALPHILTLTHHFLSHNLPIIATQHGHSPADLSPPFANQLVRKWGVDGSIATGSRNWELIPEIQELVTKDDIPVVPKNTYDAFLGTGTEGEKRLDECLEEAGVRPGEGRVVVVGVMTDCCVDTTGRSAFNRGFETWVVGDACGSGSGEQHERGLKGFAFAFGEVLGTEEVVGWLK